jgi:hypothetical protein
MSSSSTRFVFACKLAELEDKGTPIAPRIETPGGVVAATPSVTRTE